MKVMIEKVVPGHICAAFFELLELHHEAFVELLEQVQTFSPERREFSTADHRGSHPRLPLPPIGSLAPRPRPCGEESPNHTHRWMY